MQNENVKSIVKKVLRILTMRVDQAHPSEYEELGDIDVSDF